MISHGLVYTKILIHDTIYQKLWAIMTSGMNHPAPSMLLVSKMNPQSNILNQFLYVQISNITTGCLKPIILRFITGYSFLQLMFNEFLDFILFYICKVSSITRNAIIYLHETITETISYAPTIWSD